MKFKQLLRLISFLLLPLLGSCVTDNTTSTTTVFSSDAEIKSFNLVANDKVMLKLDKVFFTIDQQNELIYNADSLPVGTKITKSLAQIAFASASSVKIAYKPNDSIPYLATDSLLFTAPFKITVTAIDGLAKKTYTVQVNVHAQVPDSLNWQKIATATWDATPFTSNKTVAFGTKFMNYMKTSSGISLYESAATDGIQWTSAVQDLPTTALVQSLTIFNNRLYISTSDLELWASDNGYAWSKITSETGFAGIIGAITDHAATSHLIVLKVNNGNYNLAASTDGSNFALCGDAVIPTDFPISGFATNTSAQNRLTIVAGKDKTGNFLSSVQQMYWDFAGFHIGYNINNDHEWFSKRQGANSYFYDGKMVLICGNNENTDYKDMYTSRDNGISWTKVKSLINLPTNFTGRSFSSVIVDNQNFVWVFGGLSKVSAQNTEPLNEIWKGRINRYGFRK